MATRAITFNVLDGFHLDLANGVHNLSTNALSIRLTSTTIAVTAATNTALTEVTGANYTAGGILASASANTVAGVTTYESAVDFKWLDNASGFSDAYMAVIYNDTTSRIIAVSDIRDGATVVSSIGQDVDINLENGTDLFTLGA